MIVNVLGAEDFSREASFLPLGYSINMYEASAWRKSESP